MNSIHTYLQFRRVTLEPYFFGQEVDGLFKAHVAGVKTDIKYNPCGTPETIAQLGQPDVIALEETLLKHQLFGKKTPALGENGFPHNLAQQARVLPCFQRIGMVAGVGFMNRYDGYPRIMVGTQTLGTLLRGHPVLYGRQYQPALEVIAERVYRLKCSKRR